MRGGIFKASAIGALLVVLPVVLLLTAAKGGATVAAGASFHSSTSPSGPTVYVSPAGNDAAAGTRLKPFRTLQRARNYVRTINRNMSRDITVYLKGGTYRLPQTLTFTSRDSGTNAHNVIWTAFGSAMPVISGAVRITGWKLSNPSMDMWAAAVPKGFSTRQVYVDGVRAVLDSGLPPTTFRRTPTGYIASTPIMSGWRNPREIDFVYATQLGKMTDPMCPVAAMKGTTITMAQPCWDNSTRRVSTLVGPPSVWFPTSIENAYELLDKPGQFYLDGSAHRLYYIPRSGQNMRTADVETPVLTTLLSGKGTTATPIHNIVFANLQFSFATWLQPGTPQGFSEVQAGYTLTGDHAFATEGLCGQAIHGTCPYGNWTKEPAGIQFSFDRKLSFINDRFLHLGAAAINLDVGSQAGTIARSIFTDISGNGIEIGGVGNPNARGPSQTASMLVTDNHLYGLPAEYHGGVAILTGYMADSIISHNQIDHISYSAISTGWGGWPNKLGLPPVANFSHDNIVSDNLIYDFMLDSSDGGGVYSQGITGPSMAHGELVTGNVIHDQLTWSDALKSDDGATFVHYTRNVTYDNAYDWGWSQGDYIQSRGKFDQQLVRNNYWQQGFPQASILGITASDNSIIAGVEQAPKAIVAGAGIEPRFRGILAWRPTGVAEPAPPDQVTTLYAYRHQAFVTWQPDVGEWSASVSSYTVAPCPWVGGVPSCQHVPSSAVTISTADYRRLGYAIVGGLTDGTTYSFEVTANSRAGSSTPSLPSPGVAPNGNGPALPSAPTNLSIEAGVQLARLMWNAPQSDKCGGDGHPTAWCANPVLGYVVTSSDGRRYTAAGLSRLIVSNHDGRVLLLVGGLRTGHAYTFKVAALTPAGPGPASTFPSVTPA